MSEAYAGPAGLLGSLRRIGDSLIAVAQSRLQLFALELRGERLRLMDTLLWLSIAVLLGGVGLRWARQLQPSTCGRPRASSACWRWRGFSLGPRP